VGEAHFYHLTRQRVEEALPLLLSRALGQGWRVAVRGRDVERLAFLDEKLWLGPQEGFLPHGLAGGPHDARQPVLLVPEGVTPANRPDCVMTVDGAELTTEELGTLKRGCVVFDANAEDQLASARELWMRLTGAGVPARYWSQEAGRWEAKATRNV
jgi:DNA polymerase-3 subunit chi